MTPQELEREISQVRDAIRLLSSMVDGGEIHTDTSLEMSNNAFRILNAWLASAERFGWHRFDAKDESTFPKKDGYYPTTISESNGNWYDSHWAQGKWQIDYYLSGIVLAYYELPTFEQEKL